MESKTQGPRRVRFSLRGWLVSILMVQVGFVLWQCQQLPDRLATHSPVAVISVTEQMAPQAKIAVDRAVVENQQFIIAGWAYDDPFSAGDTVLQVLIRSGGVTYALDTVEMGRKDVVLALGGQVSFVSEHIGYQATVPLQLLLGDGVYQVGMLFLGPLSSQYAWSDYQFSLQTLAVEG